MAESQPPAIEPDLIDSAASPQELRQRILNGFRGTIEPVQVGAGYKFGIAAVAFVMILLPLLYLGFIGLVAYAIKYHVVNHTGMFRGVRGRGAVFVFLLYIAPIVIGAILVLFMFKPLFSRPAETQRPLVLRREKSPLLFPFVDRICDIVESPRPKQIALDCQVNASASFRKGLLSFFGNDLRLTIGMPLVAGMTLPQFAGVLAHEFGHFAQGAGMRLTYVIRSISFWFTRVVYERDEWDEKLKNWSRGIDLRIGWILYATQLFVWLTRRVLWVLMMIGNAVSGYMLRQMEFDADRYEARMGGSRTFIASTRRLQLLGVAYRGAMSDLGDFYREGRLADDLPALIVANIAQMPPEFAKLIDDEIRNSTTGFFDTHPCDAERIASAKRENVPGIFHVEAPASALFEHFRTACKRVTIDYYRELFGEELRQQSLHSVDDLIARQQEEQDAFKALERGFQGAYRITRPVTLNETEIRSPGHAESTLARLKKQRSRILATANDHEQQLKRFDKLDAVKMESVQAKNLLDAGFKVKRDMFSRDLSSLQKVRLIQDKIDGVEHDLAGSLSPFDQLAIGRLETALQLLFSEQVTIGLADVEFRRSEVASLLGCFSAVRLQLDTVRVMQREFAAFALLLENLEGNEENEKLIDGIRSLMRTLCKRITAVRSALRTVEYPFDHAKAGISVGEFAVKSIPDVESPGEIYEASESLIENLFRLHARLTGQLFVHAEAVEQSLGLEPLPEPPEEKEDDAEDYES